MEEVSFIKNDTSLVSGESSLQVVIGAQPQPLP
jgi:hypothetical protein